LGHITSGGELRPATRGRILSSGRLPRRRIIQNDTASPLLSLRLTPPPAKERPVGESRSLLGARRVDGS